MDLQIISDLHIEKWKVIPKTLENIINPKAPNLIIAGDFGNVEDIDLYIKVLKMLCKLFKRVILVPGNHEYYSPKKLWTMGQINNILRDIPKLEGCRNLIVLINRSISIGNIMIYGSTLWTYCFPNFFKKMPIYTLTGNIPTILSAEAYNSLHYKAVADLINCIKVAKNNSMKLLVVTHHAPTFNGVLNKDDIELGPLNAKIMAKISHNDYLINHKEVVKWIYGHTSYNGNIGKLASNQLDIPTGISDMVVSI